jgi:hypothetical protein
MRTLTGLITMSGVLVAPALASAQRSDGPDVAARMMAFDKNKDGTLTRAEVTDARLKRLFDRADADRDGIVTKQELTALAASEPSGLRGGPPGFGGPPGGRPGGPMMGPPRPGEVLPQFMQQGLNLSAEQKQELAQLQKDVDARLAKILTAEQKQQLQEMRPRGPGRFGPPGGGPPPPPDGDGPPVPPPGEGPPPR